MQDAAKFKSFNTFAEASVLLPFTKEDREGLGPKKSTKDGWCGLCPAKTNAVKWSGNRQNMVKHLEKKHLGKLRELQEQYRKEHQVDNEEKREVAGQVFYLKDRRPVDPVIERKGHASFVRLVILENLPLTLGDSKHVKTFIDVFHGKGHRRYYPCSYKTAIKYLMYWTVLTKNEIKIYFNESAEFFDEIPAASFQYDLWTSGRQESVLAVTGTFFHPTKGLKHVCFDIDTVEGRHTGENVAEHFESSLLKKP